MAHHEREVAPGFGSIESPAAKVAHHFRIGAQRCVLFEIVFAPRTQDQAIRFELNVCGNYLGLAQLFMALRLFMTFPAHAVFGVFESDTAVSEFATDFVSAREVATASCFLSFVD